MPNKLKRLSDQVVVITGASSGIGLVTARQAARRGARLVLVARNEKALRNLTAELKQKGCEAIHVAADVGIEADVERIATEAMEHYGGFDTWINNAGVSIYGSLDQPSTEEHRRLFDTNFWGVVYGSLIARRHLRQRGGAIITVGSLASDIGTPVQGMYAASKHAAKGFLEALRIETEKEGAPIAITLIKPASIDSMLPAHACNHMPVEPRLSPPVYAPETVAEAILYAAEHPSRDIFVGGMAVFGAKGAHYAPRLADRVPETYSIRYQKKKRRDDRAETGNLFSPTDDGLRERQGYSGFTFERSLYTKAVTTWKWPMLTLGAAAATLLGMLQHRRRQGR
jgi:short-subunit dehydrogenase